MDDEPNGYTAEHVKEKLLRDQRVAELDVHVVIDGGRVVITGHVATPERRDAVTQVVMEMLPELEVCNETTVAVYPAPPQEALP